VESIRACCDSWRLFEGSEAVEIYIKGGVDRSWCTSNSRKQNIQRSIKRPRKGSEREEGRAVMSIGNRVGQAQREVGRNMPIVTGDWSYIMVSQSRPASWQIQLYLH